MVQSFENDFHSPPKQYRPVGFWSWNGELTEARITDQMQQFAAQGFGAVFMHPRPGYITEYLSDRWMELWAFTLAEGGRLDLDVHIYDEAGWPGGFAGGEVISARPHLAQQALMPLVLTGHQQPPRTNVLGYYRLNDHPPTPVSSEEARAASLDDPIVALVLSKATPNPTFGNFPPPDPMRRETTDVFIETTYERYAAHSEGHLGTRTRFSFNDEPQVLWANPGMPMSRHVMREFRREHGYDLPLDKLCFIQPGSAAARFDYFWTLNRLFNQNFMRPIYEWCEAHDLMFTGHLMENQWPRPSSNPDVMSALRWMQAPGNDLLAFQFVPTTLAENALYLFNLKELSSVQNQLGREWTTVETSGGGGYDVAFHVFKPLEDFVLAHGVNVITPHLSHVTIAGARKYDWAQTISDHSAWWPHYRAHADHIARTNTALSQGREYNRVLVLQPTTSAWLHYAYNIFQFANPDTETTLNFIKEKQLELVTALYEAQIDFDLGDELILAEFGRVEEDKLVVGERQYEAVVVPAGMENWLSSTVDTMRDYLEARGHLYALRPAPYYVNGRQSKVPFQMSDAAPNWHMISEIDDLIPLLREQVPPRLSDAKGNALTGGLVWRRVELEEDDAMLWFFANPWSEEWHGEVRLAGQCIDALDTSTGTISPLPCQTINDVVVAPLQLPPRGHALWRVRPQTASQTITTETIQETPIDLRLVSIERDEPNLLFLDYCDLEIDGQTWSDINTIHADNINWQHHGFDRNPWSRAHQFRRTVIDRPLDTDSGFRISYRFTLGEVSAATLDSLEIAIERPWLYRVTLNDQELDFSAATSWFDMDMRSLPITAQPGDNTLTLEAHPFHMLAEIMPVYLRGDFGLQPAERGFLVVNADKLDLGDWIPQGMPFYPAGVTYRFQFTCERDDLVLQLGDWQGAVVSVALDEAEVGVIMHPPYRLPLTTTTGTHQLTVKVIGNMKNMMGPHFWDGLPGTWSWEICPDHMPPGERYRLYPSGLLEKPSLLQLS